MEIKATLHKPYTEEQRIDFIIEQNHNLGYEIRGKKPETLTAWGYTEEEKEAQERERIDNLELTGTDVERAIYEAKEMNFDDLINQVIQSQITGLDVKRLEIELKANHFVRKHPYINIVGQILGYTPEDMDYLFINKELPKEE